MPITLFVFKFIIGAPADPGSVLQLCINLLKFLIIFPIEKAISFPKL